MAGAFDTLPPDLFRPEDDGAAAHLPGLRLPSLHLPSTSGGEVDLSALGPGYAVIYCYPQTGLPGQPMPDGWDGIPGARGCTPQACGFRDHQKDLAELGAHVFGLSAQTTAYQREAVERLHLPFELLSDPALHLAAALRLPTFEAGGERLYKRLTLIVKDGVIEHVFYPVFPPDKNAEDVVRWLQAHQTR